jgi:prepilin-type N-terminal cleavage/methylation domain-containing protein
MHTRSFPLPPSARGFTMTELMISLVVIGLTMAGVVTFTYQALNVYAYDSGRLLVNHDIRKFTGDMITDAVYSNYFRIYTDFATRSTTTSGVTSDAYVSDGLTGDFLLLVFTTTNTSGVNTVNRLVGYYRDPDGTGVGPVRKFDVTVSPAAIIGTPTNSGASPPVYTLYDLLNAYAPTANAHTNGIVIQLAQGLASGNLFYNFYDRSIMIRGQINEQGSMIRRAVNTYNFTVSPRG